jgi:hypothetical protein
VFNLGETVSGESGKCKSTAECIGNCPLPNSNCEQRDPKIPKQFQNRGTFTLLTLADYDPSAKRADTTTPKVSEAPVTKGAYGTTPKMSEPPATLKVLKTTTYTSATTEPVVESTLSRSRTDAPGSCVPDGEFCAGKTCSTQGEICKRVGGDGKHEELCAEDKVVEHRAYLRQ